MKIACVQMDMVLADVERNYASATALVRKAAAAGADTIVLPETWSTGFYPRENLKSLCDSDGVRIQETFGALAGELGVNIVAGSVANLRGGGIYNTCFVFDRKGNTVARYDKTHLFSPMGEDVFFTPGENLVHFELDGRACSVIICYDVRFPELTRTLALGTLDCLFIVSQWPAVRMEHLHTLCRARAIENQMFVAVCNSCGTAGETVYGGGSMVVDPWGRCICRAGEKEEIITADCDFSVIEGIRNSINVFRDRRSGLYDIK